ncbi:MAG: folate family ECF transporter S component [Clostridia bacterium]|nr:folate family ECF transporter S component [Clostridia bacterium]
MHYSYKQRALRLVVFCALLAAISIVTGKYLAFNMGEFLRFSFENLPIIFAGMAFGPVAGALVGAVADLIGCLLVGYAINPIITLGAVSIGLISGLYRYTEFISGRFARTVRLSLTVLTSHLVGSVLIKSFGLSVFYDMPLIMLMLWRLLNYLIVGTLEGFILYHLINNKSIKIEISKIMKGKGKK